MCSRNRSQLPPEILRRPIVAFAPWLRSVITVRRVGSERTGRCSVVRPTCVPIRVGVGRNARPSWANPSLVNPSVVAKSHFRPSRTMGIAIASVLRQEVVIASTVC